MKIRTKAFWKFQLAVAFVTAIIQAVYGYVTRSINFEPTDSFAVLSNCIIPVIIFAIILFPVWKLWSGKSWYSLSLLFLCAITIIYFLLFILSFVYVCEITYAIAWLCIIFYIYDAPANLVIAGAIGLIGKYLVNKYPKNIS